MSASRQVRRFEARKGVRTVGFTPIPNRRVDAAIAAAALAFRLEGHRDPEGAARSMVARQLPAARMVANHYRKPSKSDDPAYRKPFVRDRARGEEQS